MHEDKKLDDVEKFDTTVFLVNQDKVVSLSTLTPHIDFFIPNKFNDVVEHKAYLLIVILKVIPALKQVYPLVEFLSFHTSKLKLEFSPTKGECCRRLKKIFILILLVTCIFG